MDYPARHYPAEKDRAISIKSATVVGNTFRPGISMRPAATRGRIPGDHGWTPETESC